MFLREKLPETEIPAPITEEPWRKALRDAAELIRTRGHCKGDYTDASGALCLVGAIRVVTGCGLAYESAASGECIALTLRVAQTIPDVLDFNDAPERTAEEVISALESAARS